MTNEVAGLCRPLEKSCMGMLVGVYTREQKRGIYQDLENLHLALNFTQSSEKGFHPSKSL